MGLRAAAAVAFTAGILMMIGNVVGSSGIFGTALNIAIPYTSGYITGFLTFILRILDYIASLGGFAVIIGAYLFFKKRKSLGKFVIRLGAGMGLIGFILLLGTLFMEGLGSVIDFIILISQSLGWIGIILAITSTIIARS
jgi:hypothetical protein